jgi:hypothetical protein
LGKHIPAHQASSVANRHRRSQPGLRSQLIEREGRLLKELQEVREARDILQNDESVNRLLKVFDVANKR